MYLIFKKAKCERPCLLRDIYEDWNINIRMRCEFNSHVLVPLYVLEKWGVSPEQGSNFTVHDGP